MTQSTTAILENGTLRLLKPLDGIPEHTLVRLTVESLSALSRAEQLEMLRAVPVDEELAAAIEEGIGKPWRTDEF